MIQLACASLSAEGFEDSGFERTFAMIPEAGYAWIEFNLWFGRMVTPECVSDIRRRCAALGLGVSSVFCTNLGGRPERLDMDVAHKLRMMEIAEQLGATRLVTGGGPKGAGATRDAAIEALKLIAPEARRRGLRICLENHQGFTLESIADYDAVLDAVPDEHVGICIDTGHFDAASVDMDALLDRHGPRVNHLHVKENRQPGVKDFCRFGEGATDNAHVIERLIEMGYDGFIVVEQSPQKDRPTSVDDLRKPFDMFNQYVSDA
jgi:sugar phosphate isomerase/epimerase